MAEVPMNNERSLTQYNNSFAAKSTLTQAKKEEESRPKLECQIQGGVSLKHKTPGQRFMDRFIKTDARTVGSTLLEDVIWPALTDLAYNIGHDALSMFIYGDTRGSRKGGLKTLGGIVRDYTSFSSNIVSRSRDRDRTDISRSEDSPRYDNLVFDFREDADNILWSMREYIATYNDIQIIRLYELVKDRTGVDIPMSAQDAKFGWSNLSAACVRPVRGGYLLDLPKPIILEH